MVIAVVAVLVVQAAVYDVVGVVAVRYSFVAAAFAVNMADTGLHGVAAVVFDGGVAAAFAVNVLVVGMGMAVAHFVSFHQGVFIDGAMIVEMGDECK